MASLVVALTASTSACDKSSSETKTNPSAPELTMLRAGDPAPDVTLPLHDGTSVKLSDLKGSVVLLYFYPKDDTPGCTVEAQGLRDSYEEITKLGVKVYGVSLDDAESHKAFIDKHDLPFPLVVGDDALADAFNVSVKLGFASRQSFLIGKDGKLLTVWRAVTPKGHAEEVIAAVKSAG
jgi:peroxiredoxin Q/BCP